METPVLIAFNTACVSLGVSLMTFISARRSRESETSRQERQLQRKLTERLYELRIGSYPKAFSITQQLLGGRLFSEGISMEECTRIARELDDWGSKESNFSMSKPSLKAFYRLRDVLKEAGNGGVAIDDGYLKRLFEAKNFFRGSLVQDVQLLFSEDRKRMNQTPEPIFKAGTPPASKEPTEGVGF